MTNLRQLLYWLGHGFPLHRAWNLARHPSASHMPKWQVYSAATSTVLAVIFIVLFVIRAVRAA